MEVLRLDISIRLCVVRFPHRCLEGISVFTGLRLFEIAVFLFSIIILDQSSPNNQIATTNIAPKQPQPNATAFASLPPQLHPANIASPPFSNDAHNNQIATTNIIPKPPQQTTTTFAFLPPLLSTTLPCKHHITFVPETTPEFMLAERRSGDFYHVHSVGAEATLSEQAFW